MSRALRFTAVAILFVLSAMASYLAYYDYAYFQPALASIRQHMQFGSSSRVLPRLDFLLRESYRTTLEFHAAHVLLGRSSFGGGDGWRSFVWGKLVELHLSKKDQVAVVVGLGYMGSNRYGFPAASSALFSKSLDQLTDSELATLVALVSAPSYYEARPEMLVKRRDQLLAKAGNAF